MVKHEKVKSQYACILLLFLFWVVNASVVKADTDKDTVDKAPNPTSITLQETIKNTVAVETANLEELKTRIDQLKNFQKAVSIEINAFNIQDIVHNNLLLQPATSVTTLEKAYDDVPHLCN